MRKIIAIMVVITLLMCFASCEKEKVLSQEELNIIGLQLLGTWQEKDMKGGTRTFTSTGETILEGKYYFLNEGVFEYGENGQLTGEITNVEWHGNYIIQNNGVILVEWEGGIDEYKLMVKDQEGNLFDFSFGLGIESPEYVLQQDGLFLYYKIEK
ncbi:MAG: hypothetical protein IJM98_02940 [Oscillospiraceae bacterium]|nr:hypothetical protein [Oscillospiraceae bacterium]